MLSVVSADATPTRFDSRASDGIFSTGNGDTLEERCEASFQQMLHRLDLILERLIWAGLTCKMSKCTFFSVRVEYLGHIVSRDGLAMAASKIEAVSNIDAKSINTLEKVRQFLGLCSYYRKFIRRFAIIACTSSWTRRFSRSRSL
jgi:hypothetical protein